MIVNLLLAGLGAWVVWEWLISLLPLRVPPPLQPLCVACLTYMDLVVLDRRAQLALAATGVVAILHAFVRSEGAQDKVVMRRRTPAGPVQAMPSRIPDLPDR